MTASSATRLRLTCVIAADPSWSTSRLTITDDFIRLVGNGTDATLTRSAIRSTSSTPRWASLYAGSFPLTEDVTGETSFVAYVDLSGLSSLPDGDSIDGALVDARGGVSPAINAAIEEMPRPALGDACDEDEHFDICVDGTSCDEATDLCVTNDAPTITTATVQQIEGGAYNLTFEVSDTESDVEYFEFTYIDASGADLPIDVDGDGAGDIDIARAFLRSETGAGTFTADARVLTFDFDGALTVPADAVGIPLGGLRQRRERERLGDRRLD